MIGTADLSSLPPLPLVAALSPLLLTCYTAGLVSMLASGLKTRLPSQWTELERTTHWPPTVAVLPPWEPPGDETVKQTFPEAATRRHQSAVSTVRWSVDIERTELGARR